MRKLSSHILTVSSTDSSAQYSSITAASEDASEGDQIIVGDGIYSNKTTGEKFPIYVPPCCQLVGSGADTCKIDGEGQLEISVRPVNPYQSLVLLGNKTVLNGFTISNSGANAVSNEQDAKILLLNNILRDNGQHGLLIFGTSNAVVQKNKLINNGTKKQNYKPPRSQVAGRQGHQIFIESRSDTENNVTISGNKMDKTYADGIAIDIFDQPDNITMHVKVIDNIISNCGRNGFSMAGSYGPSNSKVHIEIRNNQILKTAGNAIDAQAAFALIFRTISNIKMKIDVIQNEIKECVNAINVLGAFSPAKDSKMECNIIGNAVSQAKEFGIRCIGGVGMDSWSVQNIKFHATIANNIISETGPIPIFAQGGISAGNEVVKNNTLFLHILGNTIKDNGKIIINDGIETNSVQVLEGSQELERRKGIIGYNPS